MRTYFGASSAGTQLLGACTKIKGHQHYPNQSHTDPGINWDWEKYYRLINQNPTVTTLNSATGNFYDSGGISGNYQDDERLIWTISPSGTQSISVSFTQFSLENNYDYLYIYNGNSIDDALIGVYTGTQNPGIINSVNGSLTFEFRSDCGTTASGWQASWTSIPNDSDPPVSVIAPSGSWKTADWTVSFTDSDNGSGVADKYYLAGSQIPGFNGWSANSALGFVNEDFQDNATNWNVVNGNFLLNNQAYVTNDPTDGNTNTWMNVQQSGSQAYLFHWQQTILSAGTNQRAGMHFFCDDPALSNRGNSYFVYFREETNRVQIYKVTNNVFQLLTDDTCVVAENVTYDAKVTYDPLIGDIKVYLNNQLVSVYHDSSPLLSGNSISLRSGNCAVSFDNVRVYKKRSGQEIITVGTGGAFFNQSQNSSYAGLIRSLLTDSAGNWSAEAWAQYQVDWTAPVQDFLFDGNAQDTDTFFTSLIEANWAFSDPHSALNNFRFGIGTLPGLDDVIPFTDLGSSLQLSEILSNPIHDQIYYVSIVAENTAQLTDTFSTDGQRYIGNLLLEENALNDIVIYPNPIQSEFAIMNLPESAKVEVFDDQGKLICRMSGIEASSIKCDSWAQGLYHFRISFQNTFVFKKAIKP